MPGLVPRRTTTTTESNEDVVAHTAVEAATSSNSALSCTAETHELSEVEVRKLENEQLREELSRAAEEQGCLQEELTEYAQLWEQCTGWTHMAKTTLEHVGHQSFTYSVAQDLLLEEVQDRNRWIEHCVRTGWVKTRSHEAHLTSEIASLDHVYGQRHELLEATLMQREWDAGARHCDESGLRAELENESETCSEYRAEIARLRSVDTRRKSRCDPQARRDVFLALRSALEHETACARELRTEVSEQATLVDELSEGVPRAESRYVRRACGGVPRQCSALADFLYVHPTGMGK